MMKLVQYGDKSTKEFDSKLANENIVYQQFVGAYFPSNTIIYVQLIFHTRFHFYLNYFICSS